MFGRMRDARRSRVDEAADRAVERAHTRRQGNNEEAETAAREERLSERFAAQWHEIREARRVEEPVIEGGASNFSRAQVPWAFDLAAAWSWRILVVAAAVFGTLWLFSFFAVVVLPLLVALFASALLTPVVHWLMRIGAGRRIASLVVVIFSIAAVALLLTLGGLRTGTQHTVHPAATPEPTPTVQPTLKGRDLFGGSLENGVRYRTRAFVPTLSFVTNSPDWFVYDGTKQDTLALDLRKQVGALQQEGPPIATLAFVRIPKVYDPSKPFADSLEPAPASLYSWLRSHPDLRVGRSTPVTVAGVRGQRFDAVARFDRPAHEDPQCRQRTLKPCTFIAPNVSFLDGDRMQVTILR